MFYEVFGCLSDEFEKFEVWKTIRVAFFFSFPAPAKHPVPMTGIGRTAPSTNLFYCTLA
jgi:hypothetical protein